MGILLRWKLQKLSSRFNNSLKDGIDEIYLGLKQSHLDSFNEWQKRLFEAIDNNITDLNPTLHILILLKLQILSEAQ